MKTRIVLIAALLAPVAALRAEEAQPKQPNQSAFSSLSDKASYAMGMDFASGVKRQQIEINPDLFAKGMQDVMADRPTLLTRDEMKDALIAYQKQIQPKLAARRAAQARENTEKSRAFLDANKKKEGVVTLPSGLQYRVLRKGTGKTKPTREDVVTVNYKGTLVDGTEFDSSYKRGKPVTFPVRGVIRGWQEALQLMTEGAKWELVIPPELAYGPRGTPGIPPNSTLIFEVELLGIQAKPEAQPFATAPTK